MLYRGMHLVDEAEATPVTRAADLRAVFQDACKPVRGLIGMEHELVGVDGQSGSAIPYEGGAGVRALFNEFLARGWQPIAEGEHVIAMSRGASQITFEPGGQVELAAAPHATDDAFAKEFDQHLAALRTWGERHGVAWLGVGLRPFGTRRDVPWMPKARYQVMQQYMPTVGTHGLDMMLRTATVQANLDYASEADAASALRCLYGVTSILTALYASSPVVDGELTSYQSYRAQIWRGTDPARCGLLDFVFATDEVFSAYTEWALDVPMYFVFRRGSYQPVTGLPFRRFLHEGWEGEHATLADWKLHLSTLFPEVRLKGLIEVRGCDLGTAGMIKALGPLIRGLVYDGGAREAAISLTASWTPADRQSALANVPQHGLRTTVHGRTLQAWAQDLLAIATDGLKRTAPNSAAFLDPLREIADSGRSRADHIADLWRVHVTPAARVAALTI